jgi:hypothetical protein
MFGVRCHTWHAGCLKLNGKALWAAYDSPCFERSNIMSTINETNWYGTVFKSWPVKQLGPKPTADQLASIHNLGARPGKQALAIAMGLRDCGVTNSQIVIACGAPQLNKMRGYITDAFLKRLPVSPSPEGHTVYKLEVTPKGKQRIERTLKAAAKADEAGKADSDKPAAKPAKAKGTGKRKAKATPATAEMVTNEPASQPVAEQQPQA